MRRLLLASLSAAAILSLASCGQQKPQQTQSCNAQEFCESDFDTTGNKIADEPAKVPTIFTTLNENPPKVAALHVSGSQLLNENGEPVQLRGMSFGWHNWHGQFFNETVVHRLTTEWNISIIRCPMGVGPNNDYLKNPENAYKCVDNIVKAAINEGIYVIIDWHSHQMKLNEARYFFGKMAEKYGRYPNVIFEIFNEPIDHSWDELKNYGEQIVAEIRKYTDNIVLMGCPKWDQMINEPAARPLNGVSNVMYTVHFYAGTHKQELRDRAEKAINDGCPVFLSEYGAMDASGDGALNYEEWDKWIKWADSKNISWIAWSISDKNETCSILNNGASPDASTWTDADLKEYGLACRKLLQSYKK